MSKSKFSNCDICPLAKQKIILGETDSPDDLSQVELLVLAENPAVDEYKQNRPLIGKAGQIFRKYFKKTKLDTIPHFINNVVMCCNIHMNERGKLVTDNPPKESKDLCKPNWEMLIKILKPKYILAMGGTVQNVMNLPGKNITDYRGKFYEYEKDVLGMVERPKIMLTYHPSFLGRGTAKPYHFTQYEEDMNQLYVKIMGVPKKEEKQIQRAKLQVDKPYNIQFPYWMKTDELCLIDVQKIPPGDTILFIFRDKNGKKLFHRDISKQFYYYKIDGILDDAPVSIDISEVELIQVKPTNIGTQATFESDIKIENKYILDYYLQRQNPELLLPLKKLFFDIEIYSAGDKKFPNPKIAPRPINAISFKYCNDPVNVFLVNPNNLIEDENKKFNLTYDMLKKFNVGDIQITLFQDEYSLLMGFANILSKKDIDIVSGWNVSGPEGFDIPTIYNRMKKLEIDQNLMSPVNVTLNDEKNKTISICGLYILDMLSTYKKLTENKKESYKLGFISRIELGESKVEYEGSLDTLYENDIERFIRYSAQDTNLLYELDVKLGHIDLKNEMRKTCHCAWKGTESTTGLLDPLCISYQKEKGKVLRDSSHDEKGNLPGAYVLNPKSGLYSWMVDFDYTSLYPSIIVSLNIGPDTYIGKIDHKIAYDYIYKKMLPDVVSLTKNPMQANVVYEDIPKSEFKEWLDENDAIVSVTGTIFMGQSKKISFLSDICTTLLNTRVEFKNKMKQAKRDNDEIWKYYYNKQWVYKILANSLYGVLGTPSFRLFKLDLAKTITLTGRELLKFAGFHLSQYMRTESKDIDPDFDTKFNEGNPKYIIYGDTDSLYVSMAEYLLDKNISI